MCGEQAYRSNPAKSHLGSPPRVRGTAPPAGCPSPGGRITPACAGNSPHRSGSRREGKDHPRVCGEQLTSLSYRLECIGSPPRVRGTEELDRMFRAGERITPACAGNRAGVVVPIKVGWDHPRVCGEQILGRLLLVWFRGSPPRVRGTDRGPYPRRWPERITPACAGNSTVQRRQSGPPQDHPRVCGEQHITRFRQMQVPGSPPRVRGTEAKLLEEIIQKRITPACAGNRGELL